MRLTEVVDGKTFKFQTEYDGFGRVKKEIYPTGYYTTNQYDDNGFLKSISTQNGQKVYEVVLENAKGQITDYKHGGDNVSITFHDKWNLPKTIISNHLDLEYEYNNKGLLTSRKDYFTDYTESFLYDNLLRLDSYEVLKGNSSVQKNSMQYEATTGSIKTKGFVGDAMSYQGKGKPPHAVSSIPKVPSLMDETPQYITYTDFNKVKQITQGNKIHTLTYVVDRQRIRSVSKTANTTTKTKYYLGNYEEEHLSNGKIRKLHYIYTSSATAGVSGSDLKAVYVENDGKDTLYYTHTDYQGNLIKVTDDKGKVIEEYAYDPWGLRRNPAKWNEADTRKSFLFDRGYTLHEHLDDFGLINMGGRVYDPLLAQFLSPDPYIQAPGNWLNYNRYAYGFNNPLMFTDPDGEWIILTAMVVAGAYLGGAAANKDKDTGKWGWNPAKWEPNLKTLGAVVGGAALGYLGGAAVQGLFAGTTTLNIGIGGNYLAAGAKLNLSGTGAIIKGAGIATAAGGGVWLTYNYLTGNKEEGPYVDMTMVNQDSDEQLGYNYNGRSLKQKAGSVLENTLDIISHPAVGMGADAIDELGYTKGLGPVITGINTLNDTYNWRYKKNGMNNFLYGYRISGTALSFSATYMIHPIAGTVVGVYAAGVEETAYAGSELEHRARRFYSPNTRNNFWSQFYW